MKLRRHRSYSEAQALPMLTRAWLEITIDFITDLPLGRYRNKIFDLILIIVDRYTKMVVYIPTTK